MKKTVLITGASSGIGKVTALMFAQKGYNVIGTARKVDRLSELKQHGIDTVALDVSKEESIQLATTEIFRRHAQIDILVFYAISATKNESSFPSSKDSPIKYSSTALAASRPSEIAQTTKD